MAQQLVALPLDLGHLCWLISTDSTDIKHVIDAACIDIKDVS